MEKLAKILNEVAPTLDFIPGKKVWTIRINKNGTLPIVALSSEERAKKIAEFLDRYARDHQRPEKFIVEELTIDPPKEAYITRRVRKLFWGDESPKPRGKPIDPSSLNL